MNTYAYPTEQQLDARLKKVEQELEELKLLAARVRTKGDNIERRTDHISNATTRSNLLQNTINCALARAVLSAPTTGIDSADEAVLRQVAENK